MVQMPLIIASSLFVSETLGLGPSQKPSEQKRSPL
jgi:hypothetical protein